MHAAGCLLVACLLLCARTGASNVEAVHATASALPTANLLDVAERKYVVALNTNAVHGHDSSAEGGAERVGGTRSVVITDHTGTRFSCELPAEAPAAAQGNASDSSAPDDQAAQRQRTVAELMASISSTCFYRVEGWWTFELCMRKHVRQFHQEKDVVVAEYVLGKYDEDATAQRHADAAQPFMEEASPTGAATRFHAHVFTNGTPCDLTGEPRSTEVRFVCPPEGGAAVATAAAGEPPAAHFIESVKEPTTCHYVLTFSTPLICQHAAFRVEEAPVAHIKCRALAQGGSLDAGVLPAAAEEDAQEGSGAGARDASEL